MKNPSTKTLKSKTQILESFSLSNFLRRDDNGDGVVSSGTSGFVSKEETQKINEVISEENGDVSDDDDDDEGPFFDLELTVTEGEYAHNGVEEQDEESDFGEEDEDELNFIDPNLSISPSDELFIKGNFIQLDSSSSPPSLINSSPNSKSHQSPAVSFLKSATKLRIFMLGFKKPQSSSSKKKSQADDIASDEKKKIAKYLKMIKLGSKKYGEKMKLSANLGKFSSSPTSVIPSFSSFPSKKKIFRADNGNWGKISLPTTTGFRVVCKHLGKSRSTSSSSSSSSSASMASAVQSRKQDDSLLQQEDGIQSAIRHCKRSFNSSSLLSRSTSDQTQEKNSSIELLRKSQSITEEGRGNRI